MIAVDVCPLCQKSSSEVVGPAKGSQGLFQRGNIVRCAACQLVFLSPLPTDEQLKKHYETGADWDHRPSNAINELTVYRYQAEARLQFIAQHTHIKEPLRFLDIGAGFGVIDKLVRQQWPSATILAVEPDADARKHLAHEGLRSVKELDEARGETFDLIILSHVLEHVPQPVPFLQRLRAYMHSATQLFIEVPNEDFLFKPHTGSHLMFFSPDSLQRTLKQAGMSVVAMETCGPLRDQQKDRNETMGRRQAIVGLIPFKSTLKHIRDAIGLRPKAASPTDAQAGEYGLYGENRIWIRCLARLAS